MKLWELRMCVACLAFIATYWAFPEWWSKRWRDLRSTWYERTVGMLITGYAGYLIGEWIANNA